MRSAALLYCGLATETKSPLVPCIRQPIQIAGGCLCGTRSRSAFPWQLLRHACDYGFGHFVKFIELKSSEPRLMVGCLPVG